jgi:hypothetical protein
MIAAPEHFVRRFQSRLQIGVVALIELLAEIVPHVADPDDALVMEIELAADITVVLPLRSPPKSPPITLAALPISRSMLFNWLSYWPR